MSPCTAGSLSPPPEADNRLKGNDMPETLFPVAAGTDRRTLAADIIIANAPDPVFVCDLEGKILEANEAVSRLLGLRRDAVLEQSISQFIGQDEAREFVVALREVVERGVTRNARLHPRSVSGEMIPTTLNASALRDTDGNIIGAIGITDTQANPSRGRVALGDVWDRDRRGAGGRRQPHRVWRSTLFLVRAASDRGQLI
jgi:PAS domain S-box-containing protein